ncbi:MAG: hypothetical protein K8S97_15245 [Anaerolineae bacterium]|nr:hypothetical protein [Anaerolineae bacterium]
MSRVVTANRARSRSQDSAPGALSLSRVALAMLLLAGTGLMFQVALTRVFSLMFQYHYVFLVVSLATLGLGLGAALGWFNAKNQVSAASGRDIVFSTLALVLLFPIIAWLLSIMHVSEVTLVVIAVALAPFLLIGWINALVYTRYTAHSNFIYGADLLGAAGGLVLGPLLITVFGPFGTMIALGVFAGGAALLLTGARRVLLSGVVLIGVLAVFAGLNRSQDWIAYDPAAQVDAPLDKTMVHILNDPAREAAIIDTQWSPFAQIDVVQTRDASAHFVFTDAGAGSIMLRYDPAADPETYAWITEEVAYLPFNMEPAPNTLIIGAGAGYDVVMAQIAGAEKIIAVEINPAMVDVTRDYADFNGAIFDLPNVTTVVTDGRNFVDRSNEQFDLIYLNFVYSQAARPGTSALAESYAFTAEAVRAYWDRLSDEGRLGVVMHSSVHGLRLLMTTLQALEDEGMTIAEALRHIVLVYQPGPDPTISPAVLLVKRTAWTEEEVLLFTQPSVLRGLEPQYIPYVWEDFLAPLADGSVSVEEYIDAYEDYNITPTTDDQPFFYHLDQGLPTALRTLLIASALLASAYFIVGAAFQPKKPVHEWARVDLLCYFALLGAGFMLAEVTLLQYFRLLLGDPIRAFSVALGALLLGGGLGSMFSQRFTLAQLSRVIVLAAAGIAVWLLIAAFVYPLVITGALSEGLFLRTVLTVILLLPLGFLLGVPFSSGLRIAGDQDAAGIPVFWGMNAVASTLGGVLASVIALMFGFQVVLLLGALLYFIVAGLVQFTWARVLRFA